MVSKFDLKKKLGAGNFGEVWLANDIGLDVQRAVKIIPPDKVLNKKNFFHEAQTLKSAEHPNVVRVEGTGILPDKRIYVSMEYLPKGSIEDEISGAYMVLTRAKRIMIDTLRGLEHAHAQGILHRDVKPGNILVGNNSEGKLSDFGLAIPQSVKIKTITAKDYVYIAHLAPELFSGRNYSFASDIYACGVTLYRFVNGDSYLPAIPQNEIESFCIQGRYPNRKLYREFIPKSLKALINKAMNLNPSSRFNNIAEMRHSLEQIDLKMNWNEKILPNGIRWSSGWDNRCYEVTRIQHSTKNWSVTTKKGHSKLSLRKVKDLCIENAIKTQAEQFTRKILQGFVLGKLK